MNKGQLLQDPFLNAIRKDKIPVSIFLVNGIKLQGQVESFDQFVILLRNNTSQQMVYKHAISSIVPARPLPQRPPGTENGRGRRQPGLRAGRGSFIRVLTLLCIP